MHRRAAKTARARCRNCSKVDTHSQAVQCSASTWPSCPTGAAACDLLQRCMEPDLSKLACLSLCHAGLLCQQAPRRTARLTGCPHHLHHRGPQVAPHQPLPSQGTAPLMAATLHCCAGIPRTAALCPKAALALLCPQPGKPQLTASAPGPASRCSDIWAGVFICSCGFACSAASRGLAISAKQGILLFAPELTARQHWRRLCSSWLPAAGRSPVRLLAAAHR